MENKEKLGAGAYVVAGLSFIPLIGVIFGIISIIRGLITKKAGGIRIVIIGILGILFTIATYGSLFYYGFVQKGGVYDDLRKQMAEHNITSLIQSIEYYKVQNGAYPKDLETLQNSLSKNHMVFVLDSTKMKLGKVEQPYFYYENNGDTYYLLGTGEDDIPFTQDDLLPTIAQKGNVGFRIKDQQ